MFPCLQSTLGEERRVEGGVVARGGRPALSSSSSAELWEAQEPAPSPTRHGRGSRRDRGLPLLFSILSSSRPPFGGRGQVHHVEV